MMQAAAEAGASVIAVARSQEHLEAARDELSPEAAGRVRIMTADMSLQSGTQQLLDGLLESGEKIHVLMNNLGLLLNKLTLTPEGRETSFVTNLLSHFQLTEGLLENNAFGDNAVIVNMTSGGMYNAPLGYQGLNTTDAAQYNGKLSYAFAKRAQVALTAYWDRKYRDKGIRSYVTHPGWAKTPGVKDALPVFWKIQNLILRTPRQGADTALWLCATRPERPGEEVVWFDRKEPGFSSGLQPGVLRAYTRSAKYKRAPGGLFLHLQVFRRRNGMHHRQSTAGSGFRSLARNRKHAAVDRSPGPSTR